MELESQQIPAFGVKVALLFITSHQQKAAELSRHLNYPVEHRDIELAEIQSLDTKEVVSHKAQEAYRRLKKPVLVEDFSLRFNALGALPGPLIKWFLQELKPAGLCRLLDGYQTRAAVAQTLFCLRDGRTEKIFEGSMPGRISEIPRGTHGFGMESIFIPAGQDRTWGEMPIADQVTYSVRRIGLKKLEIFLRENS